MARTRRGNPVNGWLVIDKPLGLTSAAVVNKARWALRAQKAGHAGTLDPLATGVLAVAFGEATKTVPLAQAGRKLYRFTVRFGQATSTDDAEGEVIAESPARPTDDQIRAGLAAFEGDILQVPPRFSAVKVAGERAYDLARDGETFDLGARPLHVHRIALVARPDPDHAEIEMTCGKGGYVRSIARDLGENLGCHAHVIALRRVASGGFTLAQAIPFELLDEMRHETATADLLPVATGLDDIPALAVPTAMAELLRRGQSVPVPGEGLADGDTAWAACQGQPVAIGVFRGGKFHPNRVFNL